MMHSKFVPYNRAAQLGKMVTRRMPGVHRQGHASYKSDGSAVDELTEKVKEFVEQNKGLKKDFDDAKAELVRITKEHNDKVEALNVELGKKDATLGDIKKEVDELRAKMGSRILGADGNPIKPTQSFEGLVKAQIEKDHESIKKVRAENTYNSETDKIGLQCRVKAAGTITIANNVGSVSISGIPTIDQNIASRGYDDTHFRDIFPIFDSATGDYVFYRSRTPTGDGSITTQTPHGSAKSQKDYDFDPIKVTAEYLAGFVDIARQALTDLPMLQSFVGNELVEDYLDTESFNMFRDLILNSTGATVSTGANPIETMIKSMAAIRQQAKRRVNAIICRPALWAQLLLTKPNDYSLPVGSVSITPIGTVSVVGVPVFQTATNALSDTKFLIGDTRQAGIMQVTGEGLKVAMFNQHDKAVYNNVITMRVEARVALLQRRLEAWAYQTA